MAPPVQTDAAPVPGATHDASAALEAGVLAPRARVVPRLLEVRDGTFLAAVWSGAAPRAVRVRALPGTAIATDQRASKVIDAGDDEPGVELPLSQVGVYEEKGARRLALVEARARPAVAALEKADGDPVDAGLVAWFAARPAHPIRPKGGDAMAWRLWEGESLPAVLPQVLTVEDARGQVVAARFLGAHNGVRVLDVDATTPIFLASILENGSGLDDAITLSVIGFVGGELRQLIAVDAGPRSVMNCTAKRCDVLGPVGSVELVRDSGGAALRARRVKGSSAELCTPGRVSDPGCSGEELTFQWNAAEKRFVEGVPTPVVLQQNGPGRPITVKRTGP